MTIEKLAKSKANAVPNCSLVKYYEAGVPQWHMEVILTMLKQKNLTVLQEFILKFISAGIENVAEIRSFLGINESAINNAVAVLQKNSFISVDIFYSKLKLTDKGEKALREAAIIVPEDIEYALYVDGLLGNIYLDTRKLYTQKELHDFDIKPVNTIIDKPTQDYLVYENVKRAVNTFKKSHAYEQDKLEGDLQEVSKVVMTYIEYKKIYVLVFMNNKSGDIELQAYEGASRNDDYGIALQKMYINNTRVFDFDSKNEEVDNPGDDSLIGVLPKEVIESAKAFAYKDSTIDKEISNLNTQLIDIKENSQDEDEIQKETATERIRFLEKKIAEMENERKGADRVLTTYDHRPLLIDALDNVQNCVIIVSPWIKAGGLNNEIIDRIEKALQKKARVVIGYGISEKEDNDEWIINKLSDIQKKWYGKKYLNIIRLSNTHEKVLIKDNEFMVITSFNWLSFKGDPNKGFRQETGYYTESKDAISQMKINLSQRLGIKL